MTTSSVYLNSWLLKIMLSSIFDNRENKGYEFEIRTVSLHNFIIVNGSVYFDWVLKISYTRLTILFLYLRYGRDCLFGWGRVGIM
uniref:Uncharacterized protein n=1 Tax=Rhizophora mucronata TaxID=61149 RepID=A0A2P2L292_RHIMU